jgi:hypothetical protein
MSSSPLFSKTDLSSKIHRSPSVLDVPPLFGRERRLLGWQGLTLTHPAEWFLRSFGGTHDKGSLRMTDDEGLRLEMLWETPRAMADVPASIQKFIDALGKSAKKSKQPFKQIENPDILPRKKRDRVQTTNFGWSGTSADPQASHGWGAAWQCETCGRVVVGHIVGRPSEASGKNLKLAAEVLGSAACHGTGGWETWSFFGLRLDLPEEFRLGRAKLLAGRLECEWIRAAPAVMALPPWTRFDERIAIVRLAAANILLENEELRDYVLRTLANPDRKRAFDIGTEASFNGHEGWQFRGRPRDWRRRALHAWGTRRSRKKPPAYVLRAWRDEAANKIFVLDTELRPDNAHAAQDVLDSLENLENPSETGAAPRASAASSSEAPQDESENASASASGAPAST